MVYDFKYKVVATGTVKIEADSVVQAKEIFDSFKEFELYDDSTSASVKVISVKKG